MGDGYRLVRAMQKVAKPREGEIVDIVMGTVTSINPLKIKVDKIELSSTFLILSPFCIEKKIGSSDVSISSHTHTVEGVTSTSNKSSVNSITLWRGLRVGDSVYMLRCASGQKYYVLQRKEGI